MAELKNLLELTAQRNASDLHIVCGSAPVLRINGELVILEELGKITPQMAKLYAYEMLNSEQIKTFEQELDLDFSFGIPGVGRYRVNLHQQRGSVGIAFRRLATEIKKVEELGLPAVVKEFAMLDKGMVLVTGAAGSGKSTTLAAMIDIINTQRKAHIITVEDPIEYLYSHKNSIIEQREVISDTRSFASALKYVLRQDPNVILVGELRDLETIAHAITAAETGHLVLGTLHTTDAVQTIDRLIDVFPPYQQQQVRVQVSLTLQGVVCQQLVLSADKQHRVAVVETMVATPAVRNLIREGKTFQIYSSLETGAKVGMQSVDMALADLVDRGLILEEDAFIKARDAEGLKRRLAKLKENKENKEIKADGDR
ncbi:MAG: type IV pilus twitching motility protein PilT [Candidatus Omnitrophica bacterium]|nr:type IV pilus twitching motility protein PilT [Candidatus Omnitrophota bacterium]MBU4478504.1 type IV pilus twitching motility protein PilT [Candidatus Omnitrophota bacterium]MCG2704400.1 type IV pilus twitching motility protein PilT [Candidatus Omnitrophota bacterium]